MVTVDKLRKYGANVEEGLSRCFNNEEFYLKLVGMIRDEKNFDLLSQSIAAHDLDAAFEAAHALKGVLGNLSLTPAYDKVCEITELLRARTDTDYSGHLAAIMEEQRLLKEMCE